jgi:hypothetical protein
LNGVERKKNISLRYFEDNSDGQRFFALNLVLTINIAKQGLPLKKEAEEKSIPTRLFCISRKMDRKNNTIIKLYRFRS